MNTHISSAKTWAQQHKVITGIIVLVVLYGGYTVYGQMTSTTGETRYVTATAAQGTIIATVSGSGQMTTLNQVDVKPLVSGEIIAIPAAQGNQFKAGQVIARIDPTDALKAVRDAETNLETAKLTLDKTLQPPDELTLTQSENSLANSITSQQSTQDALTKTYNDGFNEVSNAFLDLPSIVSGLHDLLFTPNSLLGGTNVNNIDYYSSTANLYDPRGATYGVDTYNKYQTALAKYDQNFQDYKALDRNATTSTIEATIAETYDTTLAVSDAVKSANNLIQFYEDQMTQHNQKIPTLANTQLSTLNGYTGTANAHLTSLLSLQNTIKSNTNSLIQSAQQINQNTLSLAKLKAGADPLDIRSQQIAVTQKQDALTDAQNTLADYTVRAPFDGTIAKVSAKIGDTSNSGSAIATLIANQQIAQLSLNEIDAAKIKVGQKATLTFDAVDGLSISGKVSQIDTLGTVSQGVVTYNLQISLDEQDPRVKSGMSVNATIQTNVKTDVLTVPSSAVKTQGTVNYVEVFDTPLANSSGTQGAISAVAPRRQTVVAGLADDTATEITSGLKAGDQVVTKTIAGSTKTTTTTAAPSLLGGGAGGGARVIPGGGGGGFRGN